MPHPRDFAQSTPDKAVFVMAQSGEIVTYQQLEERANQIAHLFRKLGLQSGDHIGLMMENNRYFFEIVWGAQRSGIMYTPISTHLIRSEVDYILGNCDAKAFLFTDSFRDIAASLLGTDSAVAHFIKVGEDRVGKNRSGDNAVEGFLSFNAEVECLPTTPIADEAQGAVMFYSSGTTGLPKGVFNPPSSTDIYDFSPTYLSIGKNFQFGPHTTYLSPAPLYHAAPLVYNLVTMIHGGTSILMEKFDAEWALQLMEQHQPNYSQWVPIMFVRMLKLPAGIREKYDVSSMKLALHAAAPLTRRFQEGDRVDLRRPPLRQPRRRHSADQDDHQDQRSGCDQAVAAAS
ncbi:MAG: AMP-binding protein [Chloroflexota bacterium]